MDWLTEDLKRISESKVLLTKLDDGSVACALISEENEDECPPGSMVIPKVTIFNTGDLKWMAMLLGMDGMSMQWCIYCYLRKQEWIVEGYEKGELRTIENMIEQLEKNLTGTKRRPFIPVENYAVPLLHLMIGIFNDIDEYMFSFIDLHILAQDPDPEEMKLRDEHKQIDASIDALINDVMM